MSVRRLCASCGKQMNPKEVGMLCGICRSRLQWTITV